MPTYSYDPAKCQDGGVDQMRFELGDTVTDMDGITSPLCDEEYKAILKKYGSNWRRAKYECLKAICMKLAYEVNTSVGGLSYSLSERYDRFNAMKDAAKKELGAISSVPKVGDPRSIASRPYFYNDMHDNRRKY